MDLPLSFIEQITALLGHEEAGRLAQTLQGAPLTSIRLNAAKCREVPADMSPLRRVPWCDTGYYLGQRPSFTFDPLLHAGAYYVQEASSMFVGQAVRAYLPSDSPVVVLDLCAAPGGKSTLLRSLLPGGSLLVANEVVRSRAQILVENLVKWGHPDVVVTHNDPSDFAPLAGCFDAILADVPCSGEGMFRKDPASVDEWSPANVEVCWQRQRRILSDIWGCLKPGGLLLYSTCTYNSKENEENVRWIRNEWGAEVLPLQVPSDWGITGNLLPEENFPVYRFFPHRTPGEGFFLAVLRKPDAGEDGRMFSFRRGKKVGADKRKGVKNAPAFSKEQLRLVQGWCDLPDGYAVQVQDDTAFAFPKAWDPLLDALRSSLHVLHAGIPLARLKGKDLVPCHALALSTVLCRRAFPCCEFDYRQAIAYLQREAVQLPSGTPSGFVLATYHDFPLGFLKNIGNRANNLYPQEWRIRKALRTDS